MGYLGALGLDDEDQDEPKIRQAPGPLPIQGSTSAISPNIARPSFDTNPVNLRGLPPPTPSAGPTPGIASAPVPPIGKPSPFQAKLGQDQAERSRLIDTGSGISQIQNKPLRIGAKIADTIGEIAAPRITSRIPGTEGYHNSLIKQATGRIGEDLGEQKEETGNAKTVADTAKEGADTGEANARTALTEAQTKALGEPKPKEEEWSVVPGMVGPDGRLVQQEKNSGQIRFAPDISGVGPSKPPVERTDTPEQQYIDEYQKEHPGSSVIDAEKAFKKDSQPPERPEKPQRVLGVTPDHKVIEITPGMQLPEGTQTVGGEIKGDTGKQSAQDALAYANDYIASKQFTGPGDEALMEKYFELAKPSSGFRMTQAQIEMLQKARDIMGGLEARGKHLFSPDAPYFSDRQRQQIVETMSRIEESKGGGQGAKTSAEPQRPPNVPANYVHKTDGPQGSGWYKP